jgi:methyl-accepting chemotaxis protein
MDKRNSLDPNVIESKSHRYADRTFMGGMRMSSRNGLYFFVGFLALAGLGGLHFHFDRLADRALAGVAKAQRAAALVAKVQREVAGIRNHEKDFLLRRDPAAGESLNASIEHVSASLDALDRMPATEPARPHIATLRDGLAQYGNTFAEIVKTENVIGLAGDKGVRGQLRTTTAELEAKFRKVNIAAALTQLQRIARLGQDALVPGATVDLDLVEKNYETLRLLIGSAQVPAGEKASIESLIKTHENQLATILGARSKLTKDVGGLGDLFSYMTPRLEGLDAFAERALALAQEELENTRQLARRMLIGGAAGAFVVVIGFGLMVMGSATRPLRRLAETASRLARGERGVEIPARGNIDSVGILARGLDAWMDTLAELDHKRAELEEAKAKLAAMASAPIAIPPPSPPLALPPAVVEEPAPARAAPTAPVPAPVPSARAFSLALEEEEAKLASPGGPIAAISQKLARYSQYVSAAAHDVERTESLIRGLGEATQRIVDLGGVLVSLRDQTNMLAFKSSVRDARGDRPSDRIDENLILFPSDVRLPGETAPGDSGLGARFDSIRDLIDRAERTVQAVHGAVAGVTAFAHEIATTASNQALEATNQLLHQSEYLHSLLDDIIAKIQPPSSEERTARESQSRDAKGLGGKPPR